MQWDWGRGRDTNEGRQVSDGRHCEEKTIVRFEREAQDLGF